VNVSIAIYVIFGSSKYSCRRKNIIYSNWISIDCL